VLGSPRGDVGLDRSAGPLSMSLSMKRNDEAAPMPTMTPTVSVIPGVGRCNWAYALVYGS
jgi:hypothetical protein